MLNEKLCLLMKHRNLALFQLLKPNNSSLKVLQFIINNDSIVPYIAVSSINQKRLSDLAIISIEK
ncbi:hypothetical protein FWK35_00035374 [Aphis craccivora]|uniref:Uncharacterized protein n=1 Tax=Aphis craccivora TaxID=307492 RepID=A0A6G0YG26_APHCR|nr:hypothetical protein FWK35_00035374 [Aphis craccivora]